jgi:hypothetical protein
MHRRGFIGSAVAWPVVGGAQQPTPLISILNMTSQRYGEATYMPPLLKGPAEQGFGGAERSERHSAS